jgi:hypothetical protein
MTPLARLLIFCGTHSPCARRLLLATIPDPDERARASVTIHHAR